MTKEEVDAALAVIESTISTLDRWTLIFAAMVVLGLVGELVVGISHWRADLRLADLRHRQQQLHDTDLQKLEGETADANARAAEANARALQAQLALAQFRAPRTLNAEQQARIGAAVKQFPGTSFDAAVVPGDLDSVDLLPVIEDALIASGWTELPWLGGSLVYDRTPSKRPMAGLTSSRGIFVLAPADSPLRAAADALATALIAESLDAVAADTTPNIQSTNANTIHLLIGKKP